MRAELYSKAAVELLIDGMPIETVIQKLRDSLLRHRRERLLPNVLKNMIRDLTAYEQNHKILLRVSAKEDLTTYKTEIEQALHTLGVTSGTEEVQEDDSLVGGFSVRTHDKTIDRTYKKQLLDIYQSVIH